MPHLCRENIDLFQKVRHRRSSDPDSKSKFEVNIVKNPVVKLLKEMSEGKFECHGDIRSSYNGELSDKWQVQTCAIDGTLCSYKDIVS